MLLNNEFDIMGYNSSSNTMLSLAEAIKKGIAERKKGPAREMDCFIVFAGIRPDALAGLRTEIDRVAGQLAQQKTKDPIQQQRLRAGFASILSENIPPGVKRTAMELNLSLGDYVSENAEHLLPPEEEIDIYLEEASRQTEEIRATIDRDNAMYGRTKTS